MTARQLGRGKGDAKLTCTQVLKTLKSVKVALVTLQGPPRRRTLGVALGTAGEGRLDAEGGGDGEHGLSQVEHGAQDQHLS